MEIGMKVLHKKFGYGEVINVIANRGEYAEATIRYFAEVYADSREAALPDLFEILFENEETPRKFAESSMYVFLMPADVQLDEDTGEIIE